MLQNRYKAFIVDIGRCETDTRKGVSRLLKFKAYCVERRIKQTEIAELLEINAQSVNRKLNEKEPFTLEQVKKICSKYKISADEYFV